MPELLTESLVRHRAVFYSHLALGIVAIVSGPVQFFGQRGNADLRAQAPQIHPWLGRGYVLSCLVIGGTGFILGATAFGGFFSQLGFVVLSTFLLLSTMLGWRAIRLREIRSHVEWMTRSYALILSFVTIRLWQLALPGGTSDPGAYAAATWLSFVPNLIVAEVVCYRRRGWLAGERRSRAA